MCMILLQSNMSQIPTYILLQLHLYQYNQVVLYHKMKDPALLYMTPGNKPRENIKKKKLERDIQVSNILCIIH